MSNPRIYVACLASYNAGTLHGAWLDLADFSDVEDLQAAISTMLAASPEQGAEEWAIHDYEGFAGIKLGEYENLERVLSIAQRLNDSNVDDNLVAAAIEAFGEQWEQALEEAHSGSFDHEGDYAEQLAHDTHGEEAFGPYASYIDWARMERDLELGGDITVVVVNGSRHIFTAL